jgi:uncharacterized protein (TIGR02266 family)
VSFAKTILIAHRDATVRDRFAGALADARHSFVTADTADAALGTADAAAPEPISLAIIDLGLTEDGAAFVRALRQRRGAAIPVIIFAGTVGSSDDIRALVTFGVAGYINEHAATPQILPALAPHLFPDSFDRRSSPRVALGIPVSYRTPHTIAGALTLNVGKGGLAIRTMSPLPQGTEVQVKFRLPGTTDDVDASGRIAWSNRQVGMGIQFERLSAEAQSRLDAFVDSHT